MSSYCSDDILRRVHYFIQQWIVYYNYDETIELLELLSEDYDDLSPMLQEALELFVDEIMDGIDPLLEESMIKADRYDSLPAEIKRLFDVDIITIQNKNKEIKQAFESKRTLDEIRLELGDKLKSRKKCFTCSIVKKIVSQSRTT